MRDKYLKTSEGQICYHYFQADKIPYVFLHGGGGSISSWDLVKEKLKKSDHSLLFLDLRGYGKSSRPARWQDYKLLKHAQDLNLLLNKLDIQKAVIIGHCLGAMAAATFAAEYPNKTEKLILINVGTRRYYGLISKLVPKAGKLANNGLRGLQRIYHPTTIRARANYEQFQGSHDLSLQRLYQDIKQTGKASYILQLLALFEWREDKYYSNIKAPTLIIGGEKDLIFRPDASLNINKLIKNSRFKLLKTNHISPINNPGKIVKEITDFIGEK